VAALLAVGRGRAGLRVAVREAGAGRARRPAPPRRTPGATKDWNYEIRPSTALILS
jgi:hypothetical protein